MKTDFKFNTVIALLALSCLLLLLYPLIYAQQAKPAETGIQDLNEDTASAKQGPKNVKDKIALYVFLAWVWITIFVSIYFLRLKIIEVDRLSGYGFFQNIKKKGTVDKG